MLKQALRFLLPCVALLSLFALVTPSTFAAATTTPSRNMAGGANTPCHTLEVHLHGAQPATTQCLDKKTTDGVTPQIYSTGCTYTDRLELFSDSGERGFFLCFIGSGNANLTDYGWNDIASSYTTGCSPVTFYTDINDKGSSIYESAYHTGGFTPGAVPNDSLSSVYLYSNCGA